MERNIQTVDSKALIEIIETRIPRGLFISQEGECWAAVDNETGDAWTEDFKNKEEAISWLRREFEI